MTTLIAQQNGHWTLTGLRPKVYEKGSGQEYGFCPSCGSQIYYRTKDFPRETHFYAALLEDPNAVTPTEQHKEGDAIRWLSDALGLPTTLST